MRIGEVSKKYNVSINNIYFYINSGLLVPPKPAGQYVFDEKTLSDLQHIIDLKSLGFSLKDIHRILSLYRISDLNDTQDVEDLKEILTNQYALLAVKKNKITAAQENIKSRIAGLNSKLSNSGHFTGVPLSMLPLICCPKCGSNFKLNEVAMDQTYIYDAKLKCKCGYCASIVDGVLLTGNVNTSEYDKPDVTREVYKDLPSPLLSLYERSYNWMLNEMSSLDVERPVIMESYINAWFFLHNHLSCLKPGSMLIVTDKFEETLRSYKRLIERQDTQIDILYVADCSPNLPLQKETVDLCIDFFATNEHNFYADDFWLDHVRPFLKDTAHVIGTYFYFNNGKNSVKRLLNEYPESFEQNFNKYFFLSQVDTNFSLIGNKTVGSITDSGDNLGFSFHEKGEEMYLLPYHAKIKQL